MNGKSFDGKDWTVSNLFLNIRNIPWLISIIHAGRWLSMQKNILTLNTGRGYSTLKAKVSLWTDFIKEKPNQLLASHLFKFTWEVHGLQMSCTSCKVHSRFALCAIRNVKEKTGRCDYWHGVWCATFTATKCCWGNNASHRVTVKTNKPSIVCRNTIVLTKVNYLHLCYWLGKALINS